MASDSFRIRKSLKIESGGTGDSSGDITVNSNELEFHNGTASKKVATESNTITLTNKSIDADANTITNIENADIKAGAAIDRSKLASGTAYRILANNSSGVASENAALTSGGVAFADSNGQLSTDATNLYWDNTNKRLGVGVAGSENSTTVAGSSLGSTISARAEGATDIAEVSIHRHSDTAGYGSHLVGVRSRGTEASESVVQSGDTLMRVVALGHDGTDYAQAAEISVQVDGTPASGDMPGRIVFKVSPDGSETPAEALRISNDKSITMAGLTASRALTTNSSKVLTASATTDTELGYVSGVTSAIQTQLNAKAPTASPTFSGTITTPLTAGRVVKTNASSELTASQVDLTSSNDVTGVLPYNSGGTGQSSWTTGDILYASGANTLAKLGIGSANQVIQSVGGVPAWATIQAGAKNYINYNNFESNATTGWSLGTATLTSNLPTGAPTFGSGASGNLSISSTSSNPLAGTYSLSYASSAATTAGNFLASDAITIDIADQAKVLGIKFAYKANSNPSNGNFSGTTSNSFGIAIYDVTNSAWIIPAGVFNFVQSSGVGICTGTFQTPSNMTQFRLVIYNANASAGAITMYFDDFYVGPQSIAFGPAVTDQNSVTMTYDALGTIASQSVTSWRVGSRAHFEGKVVAGTVSGSNLAIVLPSGYTLDTSSTALGSTQKKVGSVTRLQSISNNMASSSSGPWDLFYDGSTTTKLYVAANTTSVAYTKATGSGILNNSDALEFKFDVPISGWSSNTVMSADTDTRVISFSGVKTSTQSVTANTTNITFTTSTDSAGAWNGSQYTVPVAGDYLVGCTLSDSASSSITPGIYVNGTRVKTLATAISGNFGGGSALLTALKPGDLISIRVDASVTVNGISGSTQISIHRLSGPAVVAASEKVYLQYTGNGGTALTANTTNIDFTTKEVDSHGAWNGTTFAAPRTAWYDFKGGINLSSNVDAIMGAYKNGTKKIEVSQFAGTVSHSKYMFTGGLFLLEGETLTFRSDQNATLTNNSTQHWISISSQG